MDTATIRQLIQKYERKIEMYRAMVSELQVELDGATPPVNPPPDNRGDENRNSQKIQGETPSEIRDWQFYGKSQPDAAAQLLETVGHPLSTEQILESIEKGGVKVGGATPKDKKQNLYTILSRSGRFGRAAKNTWGLPNWPGIVMVKIKSGKEDQSAPEVVQQENAESADINVA